MDNQNINIQNQQIQPEQKVVTVHGEPSRKGHFVLIAVIAFAAVIASSGIMLFINSNKSPTDASVEIDNGNLTNVISQPTATPTPTPPVVVADPQERELEEINIEDADAEISTLDAELNQL